MCVCGGGGGGGALAPPLDPPLLSISVKMFVTVLCSIKKLLIAILNSQSVYNMEGLYVFNMELSIHAILYYM